MRITTMALAIMLGGFVAPSSAELLGKKALKMKAEAEESVEANQHDRDRAKAEKLKAEQGKAQHQSNPAYAPRGNDRVKGRGLKSARPQPLPKAAMQQKQLQRQRSQSVTPMPPGVRHNLARGKALPRGWERRVQVGEMMDKALYPHLQRINARLRQQMRPRKGDVYYRLGDRLIRVDGRSGQVVAVELLR